MNKKLVLVDYNNKKKEFDVPNFEEVVFIMIKVINGDEVVANVLYKNGDIKTFDSSDDRIIDYVDCFCLVPLDKIEEFNNLQGSGYEQAETALNLWERSEDETK